MQTTLQLTSPQEQLETDNALLVAENDQLRDELATLRCAEDRVKVAERELEEAWRRLREEQDLLAQERRRDPGDLSRSNFVFEVTKEDEGQRKKVEHYDQVGDTSGRQAIPQVWVSSRYDSPSPDGPIPPFHTTTSPSFPDHHTNSRKICPQISSSRPEKATFEPDCCSGILDCEALARMPQQLPPSSKLQLTTPTPKETPFDPDCCSGLFDCNALSAIPPFPIDTGRSDLDILVDVATHATVIS
jgi:hypothetical protein